MVTDEGIVKLLDFGLAKLYEKDQSFSDLPTADFPATQAGAILGTVAYMSPEQAQGQPADARSDIFSFGLVLYEMLNGRRAFSGDSASETIAALLRDEPAPLQASPNLEKIVKRCLEKNPAERFQRMSELKVKLVKATAKKATVSSEETQPSIAVLPFVNMSGDKEQEYFSDGLAEEIINALTKIIGLQVIARTSAFAFKGKNEDIRKIAEILGVANILEGSVRKYGNRIRVTAQLIEASKGIHLWSERYDREMEDVFTIQDEISQAIAEKLRVHLSDEYPLVRRPTDNLEAYNLFLKGRYHVTKFTPESLAKGKGFFEQAISIDPHYALAWQGMAEFFFYVITFGYMPSKIALSQCSHAIQKVLELDETMPEAHSLMGSLKALSYEWHESEREFRLALELESRSEKSWANLWFFYGFWYLMPLRRYNEVHATLRKGLQLDPLSPWLQMLLALFYYLTRQWDRAIEQCRNVLDLDPNYYLPYQYLGFTYLQQGMIDEGVNACEMAAQAVGQSPWALAFPAIAYARAGRIDEANRLLGKLHDRAEKTPVMPSAFAWIYCSLEDIDKGLEWFERAIDERDGLIVWGRDFPIYDVLRSHPRYKALLGRMNLEP